MNVLLIALAIVLPLVLPFAVWYCRNHEADLDPVVFHVIKTSAEAGAPIHPDWLALAKYHDVYVTAIQAGHSMRAMRGATA